jgi:8-oxo-dGTP diphosphatase
VIDCTFENGRKTSLRHVVVDALVLKEGHILLVKRAPGLLEAGKWALVGGFVDMGENTKEAAQREILEETGYKVKNLKLITVRDNPDRPSENRQNIAFVFFCDAEKKIQNPDRENSDQKWFSLDDLPKNNEFAFDHLKNIVLYKKYLKENPSLPIIES